MIHGAAPVGSSELQADANVFAVDSTTGATLPIALSLAVRAL